MGKLDALMSSKRTTWRTPEWFLDLVRRVGPIALDPATEPSNPARAKYWLYPGMVDSGLNAEICGLRAQWRSLLSERDLVFINPPYGKHLGGEIDPEENTGWAKKIAGHQGTWLSVVPGRIETWWYRTMYEACDLVCELHKRIHFVNAAGRPVAGAAFPSVAMYRGEELERFAEVFDPHGRILPGGRMRWTVARSRGC